MTDAAVIALQEEVKELKRIIMQTPVTTVGEGTLHDQIDMDGSNGTWAQLFEHGNNAAPGEQVDRACHRVGTGGAQCIDRLGHTGPWGIAKGASGNFHSTYDFAPQP